MLVFARHVCESGGRVQHDGEGSRQADEGLHNVQPCSALRSRAASAEAQRPLRSCSLCSCLLFSSNCVQVDHCDLTVNINLGNSFKGGDLAFCCNPAWISEQVFLSIWRCELLMSSVQHERTRFEGTRVSFPVPEGAPVRRTHSCICLTDCSSACASRCSVSGPHHQSRAAVFEGPRPRPVTLASHCGGRSALEQLARRCCGSGTLAAGCRSNHRFRFPAPRSFTLANTSTPVCL